MVAKKKVKKKTAKKKSSSTHHLTNAAIDRLIDSNIKMQHKMTDVMLSVKDLNKNVSELVKIFKKAGEHIKADKYEDPMVAKINDLLEQNKNISQALLMLEGIVKKQNNIPRHNPLQEGSHY
tara:strand:- start:1554 stop:1919 length:366 start_codon:yes stop_codon:yes gene_type:complete